MIGSKVLEKCTFLNSPKTLNGAAATLDKVYIQLYTWIVTKNIVW